MKNQITKRFILVAMGVCLATTAYAEQAVIRFETDDLVVERWTAADFANAQAGNC